MDYIPASLMGHGALDVVVWDNQGHAFTVFGDGAGGFGTSAATYSYAGAMAVGDFNADGKADLWVTSPCAATALVQLGQGRAFGNPQYLHATAQKCASPTPLTASPDLNADGIPDVVVLGEGASGNWNIQGYLADKCPGCTCPGSVCSGVCIDTSSDDNNCGGCGIQCAGQCSLGRCVTTLASGLSSPYPIAIDSSNVYWTSDGAVKSVPKSGGSVTVLATPGSADLLGIAVDSASVYWTDFDQGLVMKVPVGGGAATTLASAQAGPYDLAVDAANVYWTNDDPGGQVMKVPLGGGTPTALVTGGQALWGIATDGTNVYWTDQYANTVSKTPVGGGPITTLASGLVAPYDIALDATSVYWTAPNGTAGLVSEVPLGGGSVRTLASGQRAPYGIAVDASYVYWSEHGEGLVLKVPLSGGAPTTLATGVSAQSLVVDGTSVYWTDVGSGSVMKVTPK